MIAINNTRKTFNSKLQAIVTASLPGWTFLSGDEQNPTLGPNSVAIAWLDGHMQGYRPQSRIRLLQIEVATANQDTSGAEDACMTIMTALKLRTGRSPISTIPKYDYSSGSAVALNTNLDIRVPSGGRWKRLDPPQQQMRLYVLTVEIDYIPG